MSQKGARGVVLSGRRWRSQLPRRSMRTSLALTCALSTNPPSLVLADGNASRGGFFGADLSLFRSKSENRVTIRAGLVFIASHCGLSASVNEDRLQFRLLDPSRKVRRIGENILLISAPCLVFLVQREIVNSGCLLVFFSESHFVFSLFESLRAG